MVSRAQSEGASTAAELYARSGAAAYGVSAEQFAQILEDIQHKYLPNAVAGEKAELCAGLRLEELALARACAAGNERAWEDFIGRYRQKLHGMALQITREAAQAAELADSLFAELFGMNTRDGVRNSKLLFYTGRGSLEGWLRTVMAQEFINRYRKQKRTVSLEEQTQDGVQFAASEPEPVCSGIRAWRRPPTKRWPNFQRRTGLRWPPIIWMGARWPKLHARSGCMNRA